MIMMLLCHPCPLPIPSPSDPPIPLCPVPPTTYLEEGEGEGRGPTRSSQSALSRTFLRLVISHIRSFSPSLSPLPLLSLFGPSSPSPLSPSPSPSPYPNVGADTCVFTLFHALTLMFPAHNVSQCHSRRHNEFIVGLTGTLKFIVLCISLCLKSKQRI